MGNLRRRRSPSESQEDESDSESDRRGRKTSSSSRNRAESESSRRKRSSHRSSSSKRRRRRSDDDESEPESSEDSDGYRRDRGKKKEVTEEEINEYMAKKTQKKVLKVAKKLKSLGVSGYSNDSNPFGDNNLGETFVWRKKIERDVAQGRPLDISVKSEKKRQKERMARLKEIHASLLRKHLERLELPVVTDEGLETDKELKAEEEELMHDVEDDQQYSPELLGDEPRDEAELLGDEPRDEAEAEAEEEEPGSFSPQLIHAGEDDEAIDPQVDQAELDRKREAVVVEHQRRIQEAMTAKKAATPDELEMKAIKAMGIMEEGDAVFGSGAEVNLDSQVYWWHDKYRPRKPKYFNRVHTGYEWNKYNQTHYDHDNPPPKIVQGYKFNIFYPDLVDKTKAPTYSIEKDGNGETCIMRFHAGPPYQDIAFRIVNKEWEYSHKKGFKCTFERGILHVYFNFKRYRYRR